MFFWDVGSSVKVNNETLTGQHADYSVARAMEKKREV